MKTNQWPIRLPLLAVLLCLLPLVGPFAARAWAATDEPAAGEQKKALRLVFIGNRHIATEVLEQTVADELADFSEAPYPEAKADDAAYLVTSVYKQAGYAFVKTSYAIRQAQSGSELELRIDEGPQVAVSGIEMEGAHAFPRQQLLDLFAAKGNAPQPAGRLIYVEQDIRDALDAIRDLYLDDGFLQVKISRPELSFSADRSQVAVRFAIQEGERITIGAVSFAGDVLEPARRELDQLAGEVTGKPFLARRKLLLRSGVQELYGNLGYPDVKVEIAEVKKASSPQVRLVCTIASGPQVTVSAIRVTGNLRTSTHFILDRLTFRPGDIFSSESRQESFQRLYQTGLFSRVGITLDGPAGGPAREVIVAVEEGMAKEVYFQGGWGSYELLRGSAGYKDRNIFGTGRVFRAEVGGSFKSASAEASIMDPWIFNSDITADLPVFYRYREEPSFTTEEVGWSLLFDRDLRKDLSASLGYSYSSTNTTDIAATDMVKPESNYTIASLMLQATLDNRNDIFFPTSGRRIFSSAEIAEPTLGSGLAFYRFNFGARQFYPLSAKNTLALRYDGGIILPGRDLITIPIGERYFNGGEKTVRSFRESELGPKDASGDPLGGLGYNVASAELRHLLTEHLAASLFMDVGNISPNQSPEEDTHGPFTDRQQVIDQTINDFFSDFRSGLGFGFQYLLPVGPARLDFAWNPAPDRDKEEDSFNLHFSIGMAF